MSKKNYKRNFVRNFHEILETLYEKDLSVSDFFLKYIRGNLYPTAKIPNISDQVHSQRSNLGRVVMVGSPPTLAFFKEKGLKQEYFKEFKKNFSGQGHSKR